MPSWLRYSFEYLALSICDKFGFHSWRVMTKAKRERVKCITQKSLIQWASSSNSRWPLLTLFKHNLSTRPCSLFHTHRFQQHSWHWFLAFRIPLRNISADCLRESKSNSHLFSHWHYLQAMRRAPELSKENGREHLEQVFYSNGGLIWSVPGKVNQARIYLISFRLWLKMAEIGRMDWEMAGHLNQKITMSGDSA